MFPDLFGLMVLEFEKISEYALTLELGKVGETEKEK